ncbi:MAG: RNA 2',3'-cyclic phosphodiesterase, partial [Clostridia bacterium]|nr:RNA 2',3'-cyclic phosphodiesterase [Clostridia bacterium]
MRLFIALDLHSENKKRLDELIKTLTKQGWRGRGTPLENHHLTLAFIGESDDIPSLRRCLDQAAGPAFYVSAAGLSRFRRAGGDILWLGLRQEPELSALQRRLTDCLRAAGFPVEKRPFRPHLTLMRDAAEPDGFYARCFPCAGPVLRQRVDKISLMKSERRDGRIVYTELYAAALGSPRAAG